MKEKHSDRIKETIRKNGAEIMDFINRLKETRKQRELSSEKWSEWQNLYTDFYDHYRSHAFPGGLDGAYQRIVSGDAYAMEAAICFLEIRPYFFRSGYMFKDILRMCKRAPLSPMQKARLEVVKERLSEWKRQKIQKQIRLKF
ncbi:MAG TPA: hypothetical protein VGF01_16870 [Terracidiphilus sp.]|jgi:hypothetical protein